MPASCLVTLVQTSARGCGNSGVTYLTVSLRDEAGSEYGDTKVNPTAIAARTKGIQEPACRSEQTEPNPAGAVHTLSPAYSMGLKRESYDGDRPESETGPFEEAGVGH